MGTPGRLRAAQARLSVNVLWNFLGRGCAAAISIIIAPLIVRLLGIEQYGLVGFYVSLQSILMLADLGFGTAANRELARLSATASDGVAARTIIKTLELAYAIGALAIAVITLSLAGLIADHFLVARTLAREQVVGSIAIMGCAIALNFPFLLYGGALVGLERQREYNALTISGALLRGPGSLAFLYALGADARVYFLSQIGAMALQTLVGRHLVYRSLPASITPARVSWDSVRGLRRFAIGMSLVGMSWVMLSQADRLVLGRLLSLEDLGHYTLAGVVCSGVYIMVYPLTSALFPRLSAAIAKKETRETQRLYHLGTQAVVCLVGPLLMLVTAQAETALRLWTNDSLLSAHAAPVLRILIIGTAIHGIVNVSFILQQAAGWLKGILGLNFVLSLAVVPALVVACRTMGIVGAAVVNLMVSVTYFTVGQGLMHTKLDMGTPTRWYLIDVLVPALGGAGTVAALATIAKIPSGRVTGVIMLGLLYGLGVLGGVVASPLLRPLALGRFRAVIIGTHRSARD